MNVRMCGLRAIAWRSAPHRSASAGAVLAIAVLTLRRYQYRENLQSNKTTSCIAPWGAPGAVLPDHEHVKIE